VRPFAPRPFTSGGHRQTLLGYWHRRHVEWPHPCEDIVVPAGGDVRLLLRASFQPGPRAASPALVLIHGLGGWDAAKYGLATGVLAWSRGWHVIRMNMRGAGDSMGLSPVLYNAGLDGDLVRVLARVAEETPRIAVVGFSLGANLALLAAGRSGEQLPPDLIGVVGVSPPLDLEACANRLDAPTNAPYQRYFMGNLRRAYQDRQRVRPDLYAAGRELGLRSVRAYDEAITAPYGGYRDASDYYARSSAGPQLARITRPTLVLAAQDDPMIPVASLTHWPLPASGLVVREITPTGGHVGFVAPSLAPGSFWAGERALDFLDPLR
jgi:predicted alpha/beta-fold hydrolase